MSIGPVELVVLKYSGDRFTGVPAAQIQALVDVGAIRIIDILFGRKGADGETTVYEIQELEDIESGEFDPIVGDITGLLNPDDVKSLTADWAPQTAAAVILFENVWAKAFRDAVQDAGGEVVLVERIPRDVIEELVRAQEEELVSQ